MRPIHLWLALGVAVSATVLGAGPSWRPSRHRTTSLSPTPRSTSRSATRSAWALARRRAEASLSATSPTSKTPPTAASMRSTTSARSGETSDQHARLEAQLEAATARIAEPSDTTVVTLGTGGNDAGQCPVGSNAPPCPFQRQLHGDPGGPAVGARGRSRDEEVPGSGVPQSGQRHRQPERGTIRLRPARHRRQGRLLGERRSARTERPCALHRKPVRRRVGRVYPTFMAGGQSLMADALHPNDTGHAYIRMPVRVPGASRQRRPPCEASPPPPPPPPPPPDRLAPTAKLRPGAPARPAAAGDQPVRSARRGRDDQRDGEDRHPGRTSPLERAHQGRAARAGHPERRRRHTDKADVASIKEGHRTGRRLSPANPQGQGHGPLHGRRRQLESWRSARSSWCAEPYPAAVAAPFVDETSRLG